MMQGSRPTILIPAGTADGRLLATSLAKIYRVIATVATPEGEHLLGKAVQKVIQGRMDQAAFVRVIREEGVDILVDATHPYATLVSDLAYASAREAQIPYLRYQRPPTPISYGRCYRLPSPEAAAKRTFQAWQEERKPIFLTTGVKELPLFVQAFEGHREEIHQALVARILPGETSLKLAKEAGFDEKNLVFGLGPFSFEDNVKTLQEFGAGALVTKDGGVLGGLPEKVEACAHLEIPVFLIDRPPIRIPLDLVYPSLEALTEQVELLLGDKAGNQ